MNKSLLHRYRVLFTCMLGALPWMKWLLAVGIVISLIGVPVKLIWDTPAGFIGGGACLFLFLFMNAIALPYQMLSLGSSKQLALLPGIREAAFVLFLLCCICLSVVVATIASRAQPRDFFGAFSTALFSISAVLMVSVIVGQKYPRLQGLVYMFGWGLIQMYKLLADVHPIILLVVNLSFWLAFFRHWMNWRPQKYQPNMFAMSHTQLAEFMRPRNANLFYSFDGFFKLYPSRSDTIVGSILLGRSDGFKSKLMNMVGVLLGLLFLVGLFFLIADLKSFRDFFVFAGQVNIYIMYICFSYGLIQFFFRNVGKAWLLFDGKRDRFFVLLERTFCFCAATFFFPIFIVHLTLAFLLLDWSVYRDLVWITAIYSLIVIVVAFYVQFIIYHRTKGSLRWSVWVNILLMAIFVVPVIASNILWTEHKVSIMHLAYYFIVVSVLGVIALRKWAERQWVFVDLVKVNY